MKEKKSIVKAMRTFGLASIFGIALFIILIYSLNEYIDFKKQSKKLQETNLIKNKTILKLEVARAKEIIDYYRSSVEEKAKIIVKEKTYEAFSIIENIYLNNKSTKSKKQIQKMIIDALRPIRYNNGKGYFFITQYNGVEILFADKPNLEGKNLINMQDSDGHFVIQDMVKISKTQGEGLYSYKWTKPKTSGNNHKKIAYIKSFKEYNWFIGTGLYQDDVEAKVKEELLPLLETMNIKKDGYLFANTWDGEGILGPIKGKNGLGVKDVNGVEIVKELIKISKDSSGFLEYSMPSFTKDPNKAKLSYVIGIPEWKWCLGSGLLLEDMDLEIIKMKAELKNHLYFSIIALIFLIVLILIAFLLLFSWLNRQLKVDFKLFDSFFTTAAFSDKPINRNSIQFSELDLMAKSANKMLEDKVKMQKELIDERERLFVTIHSITDGIITCNNEGVIQLMNSVAEKLTGWNHDKAFGNKLARVFNVLNNSTKELIFNLEDDILNKIKDSNISNNCILFSKNNTEYNIKFSIAPILADDNTRIGVVIIFRDLTDENEIQDRLRHSERMDAIGQLSGGIAHDFNNMLAGIAGASELVKNRIDKTDDRSNKYLSLILETCVRGSELANKLLAFGRKEKVRAEVININNIIEDAVILFKSTFDKKISVSFIKDSKEYSILADSVAIQNVIINLGINASHAMEAGGTLTINSTLTTLDEAYCNFSPFDVFAGNFVKVDIIDTGSGISPDILQKIFEPFFTTKSKGKGTGLGLATSYTTIKNHHAALEVKSEVGIGTTFSLYFPHIIEVTKTVKKDDLLISGTGTILLVDDEELIRTTGEMILQYLGYKVFLAKDGEEAVAVYQEKNKEIDLVITDMMMPVMNGKEAFLKIREINKNCKVIIASGYANDNNISELKDIGISAFLPKPYKETELSQLIAKVLKN